ncbi:MAG: DMP19 family protein [Polyangia bacterium]
MANIYAITDVLWSREIAGETAFAPVERTLLDIALVEAEVNNGGFHQYFFNSAGDRAMPAPDRAEHRRIR